MAGIEMDDAMAFARATVTSVLADDPQQAVRTLTECPAEWRLNVTLALASMVAASMETIAMIGTENGAHITAAEAWQKAIVDLLAAHPEP